MKLIIKFILLICVWIFSSGIVSAQIRTYHFEDLDSLQMIEKRNVVVFIYTDWCKYCQAMKNTTMKSKKVIDKLNSNFYFISHNGEEKRDIIIKGKLFKYSTTGLNTGIHQLTEELATIENGVSYPTICILNPENEIIFQHSAFLEKKAFVGVLDGFDLP